MILLVDMESGDTSIVVKLIRKGLYSLRIYIASGYG